jgi:damage-control phosphatase, subfamily III
LHTIPFEQRNWLDSPWIIAEFYFYRRLMDIFPYMTTSYDVFHQQKLSGLLSSLSPFEDVAKAWIQCDLSQTSPELCLQFSVLTSLWGNKKDLSLWPAMLTDDPSSSSPVAEAPPLTTVVETILNNTSSHILDNDLEAVVLFLLRSRSLSPSEGTRSIGIILDNAGYELLGDLFLGYCLISLHIVEKIVFYTKKHPTFVSDATTQDALDTIQRLFEISSDDSSSKSFLYCQQMGARWKEFVEKGVFVFSDDYFWCQPVGFQDLPQRIQDQLGGHLVTFIKVTLLFPILSCLV